MFKKNILFKGKYLEYEYSCRYNTEHFIYNIWGGTISSGTTYSLNHAEPLFFLTGLGPSPHIIFFLPVNLTLLNE